MPTPAELQGQEFKRVLRAAAALEGVFEDKELARRLGVSRNTVMAWWDGAKPSQETIRRIADLTGIDADALNRYLNWDGPVPRVVQSDPPALIPPTEAELARYRSEPIGPRPPSTPSERRPEPETRTSGQ